MVGRRLTRILASSFIAFALPLSAASASSIPHLTWERSALQQVSIDQVIAKNIIRVDLVGQSQTLKFADQGLSNKFEVYQVLLPNKFNLGMYTVRANMNDGTTRDFGTVRVVEYQSSGYNPLRDVKTTGAIALTFFGLIAFWSSRQEEVLRVSEHHEFAGDETTLGTVNVETIGRTFEKEARFKAGALSSIALDHWRSDLTIRSSRFSTLIARVISDGGYLQFSLGALVLFLPVFGLLGGALAFHDISGIGYITTPSLATSIALVMLGALDSASGLIAALTFGILALSNGFFASAYDIRTYLGLSLLWFTPALIANATRPMRRSSRESGLWERTTDLVVGSILTGWAVKEVVSSLNGCAHLSLPLTPHASTLGLICGGVIAFRYLVEEYVNGRNPYYLTYLSPEIKSAQSSTARLVAWFIRALLYLFFAVSFLGATWQLWAGLALFMVPTLLGAVKNRLINSTVLYQLLPAGIPSLLVMGIIGREVSNLVAHSHLAASSQTRTSFLLLALPSFAMSLLHLIGRAPKSGDVRWYMRKNMRVLYRGLGPIFLATAVALTMGVI